MRPNNVSFNQPLPAPRRPYVETDRDPVRPPSLAPRGKAAVMSWNKYQTDADSRRAQREAPAQMYNNMAERQRKADLRSQREKKDRKESASPMTAEQWAILTPLQQAAVQANADLAGAIQRDFKDQTKHHADTAQIQDYMKQVKDLFGDDGSVGFKGLEFAPNTLAFLNERGLDKSDLGGRTLDDLVSGDTLFTNEMIEGLGRRNNGREAGSQQMFERPSSDNAFVEAIARGQLQYQEDIAAKLAKGNQLLTDTSGRSTNAAAAESFGALQEPRLRLDAVQPQTLEQIDLYMEALARPDSPIDEALSAINLDLQQRGATPKEAEQVFQEMSNRSRNAVTGEGRWFDGLDFPMRSPQEVAQALGSPTLKRMSLPGQAAVAKTGG